MKSREQQDKNQQYIEVEPIDLNPRVTNIQNARLNYFQDINLNQLMRPTSFDQKMKLLIPEINQQENQMMFLSQEEEQLNVPFGQGLNNLSMNQSVLQSTEQASFSVVDNYLQESVSFQSLLSLSKGKVPAKKNQYDKNIVGHIVSLVIKNILSRHYELEIKTYCKHFKMNYKSFCEYFKDCDGLKKGKFGTSKLGKLFSRKNEEDGIQKIFGMFMARFLKEQYVLYILTVGKMQNKLKYLECAGQLMYLPKIQKEQYQLMSRFQ